MAQPISNSTLGRRALKLNCGVAAINNEILALPPPHGIAVSPYGPLVGVRCGPRVQAVAYPLAARLIGLAQGELHNTTIAVVVNRAAPAQIIDPRRPLPLDIKTELGPAVDVGRRVLSIATPEEHTPPVDVLDVFWLDSIISATLRLGPEQPLNWGSTAMLHPLSNEAIEPWQLRERRTGLTLGWDAFRQRASNASSPWPGMDPAIAAWLDDGSFARWCLADLPEKDTLLEDLRDLLEPSLNTRIYEALNSPGEWIRRWI